MPNSADLEQALIEIAGELEKADAAAKMGRFAEAAPIYKRAYEFLERGFGPDDPDTIACLQKLADSSFEAGNFRDAVPAYKRLYTLGERMLGDTHPHVQAIAVRLYDAEEALSNAPDAAARYFSSETVARVEPPHQIEHTISRNIDPRRLPDNILDPTVDVDSLDLADEPSSASWRQKMVQGDRAEVARKSKAARAAKSAAPAEFKRSRPGVRAHEPNLKDSVLSVFMLHGTAVASVVAIAALIGFMAYTWSRISQGEREIQKATDRVVYKKPPDIYTTADGARTVRIDWPSTATLSYNYGHDKLKLPLTKIGPDWKDFFADSMSAFANKDIWLEDTKEGLRDEDGVAFYNADVRSRVVELMRQIGTYENSCWLVNHEYHDQPTAFANYGSSVLLTVPQPVQAEDATALLMADSNSDILASLRGGGLWKEEASQRAKPFEIHCLSVKRIYLQPPKVDFYVHGFDGEGRLLSGSEPGTTFVLAYRDGQQIKQGKPMPLPTVRPPRSLRVCLVKLPQGMPSLRLMHYFFPLVIFLMALLLFVFSQGTRPKSELGLNWNAFDLFAFLSLVISLIWGLLLAVS